MADYITVEELQGFGHESDAIAPAAASTLVTSASRLFDKYCGVADDFFAEAPDPAAYSDRVFLGDGTAYLRLDPYTALSPTDPVVIDPAYSYTVPTYTERDGMLVDLERTKMQSPFEYIPFYRYAGWRDGVQVTVSANWGFAEIPADVKVACMHLAFHQWRTADPAFAVISNANGDAFMSRTVPKVAQDIIEQYRNKYTRECLFV